MPAQALRHKAFGWNAPRTNIYGATVNGTALVIPFVGDALVAGAVTIAQFTCLVNGVSRTISAAVAAAASVTLTLASAVTNGQTVTVSYVQGGAAPLKDAAGDLTPSFSMTVKNNTP